MISASTRRRWMSHPRTLELRDVVCRTIYFHIVVSGHVSGTACFNTKDCCILILRMGFLLCLQYALRLKVGALLWSGLPCSMHVWMARGTSKKTRSNPRGWQKSMAGFMHDCVRTANCIAARFGLVALLCLVRQVWWDCEQPSSSLAEFLPYLEAALHPAMVMMGFQASVSQKLPLGCN